MLAGEVPDEVGGGEDRLAVDELQLRFPPLETDTLALHRDTSPVPNAGHAESHHDDAIGFWSHPGPERSHRVAR